jgi:hypothetical protein
VAADSYGDATVKTASAPLSVTGCSALSYSPSFAVTATRDTADNRVQVVTNVAQSATEAPNRSVALALPFAQLRPNLAALQRLCQDLASGTCRPVGSVTAVSPLYPRALTGQAYLTGTISGLTLTLVFPPPFPLTLVGSVNLTSNVTTFTGLPDIPLTSLAVTLDGGPQGLFLTLCQDPTGTASATLTSQNGDRTAMVPANFTIAGCPSAAGSSGSTTIGGTALTRPSAAGLKGGHPSLSFRLNVAKGAAKLRALTVVLPGGVSLITHRIGNKLTVKGVRVNGAKVKSLVVTHGRLGITLKRPVSSLSVTLTGAALRESAALRKKAAAHKLKRLALRVIAQNTKGKRTSMLVHISHLGL